jgi:hypothetical protein
MFESLKKAIKNFWRALKFILGFPPEPTEEQKNEEIPTMRQARDCAVPVVAITCGTTYEKAYKALWHWDLPFFFESPLLSNPLNVMRAIKALGFIPDDNVKWSDIESGNYVPKKLIILVKLETNFITALWYQHWVVVGQKNADNSFEVFWGDSQKPRTITASKLHAMFSAGVLKCGIKVENKSIE